METELVSVCWVQWIELASIGPDHWNRTGVCLDGLWTKRLFTWNRDSKLTAVETVAMELNLHHLCWTHGTELVFVKLGLWNRTGDLLNWFNETELATIRQGLSETELAFVYLLICNGNWRLDQNQSKLKLGIGTGLSTVNFWLTPPNLVNDTETGLFTGFYGTELMSVRTVLM